MQTEISALPYVILGVIILAIIYGILIALKPRWFENKTSKV
jgi:hypothetical protein